MAFLMGPTPRLNIIRMFDTTQKVVDQLRGGPTLRALTGHRVCGEVLDLFEPVDGGMAMPSNGIMFVDLSQALFPKNFEFLTEHPVAGKLPLIMDVHFPFWDTRTMFAMKPNSKEIDQEATEQLRKQWSDPALINTARFLVETADVVTAPNLMWAAHLSAINNNTVLLPDVHNAEEAVAFCRVFLPLLHRAFIHRTDPYFLKRIMLRISSSVFMRSYKNEYEQKLEAEVRKLAWLET